MPVDGEAGVKDGGVEPQPARMTTRSMTKPWRWFEVRILVSSPQMDECPGDGHAL
jgi:hypothetical protein